MLNLLLFAILAILLVIARELWLLRTARPQTTSPPPHLSYKPQIFTFERTGWARIIERWSATVAVLIAMLIWGDAALPYLHARFGSAGISALLSTAGDIVGISVLSFACYPLLLVGTKTLMDRYDDGILRRELTTQERDYINVIFGRFDDEGDYEHAEREYDRICREHKM